MLSSDEIDSCIKTLEKICRLNPKEQLSIVENKPNFFHALKTSYASMETARGIKPESKGFKEMKQVVPEIAEKKMEFTVPSNEKTPMYRPAMLPPDEEERMNVVRSLEILDSEEEAYVNNILWLATYLCGTEMGAMSVVDSNRQFFKSAMGLGCRETCRDAAFCSHAILQPNKLMIVENALEDERFRQNPLVTGPPYIRYYAGIPLRIDGQAVGTLCVISAKSMKMTDAQKVALKSLGTACENHIKHCRVSRDLAKAYRVTKMNERHLKMAKEDADALAESRMKFLGVMAHELRTPVNAVHGYAQLIEGRLHNLSESDAECIDSIIYGSNVLANTVNSVLDYLKLDSGKVVSDLTTCNICRMMRSTAALLSTMAKKKDIRFDISIDSTFHENVMVDQLKIIQIVNNLVCNSIKFTPKGKKVSLVIKRISSDEPLKLPSDTVIEGEPNYNSGHTNMKHDYILIQVKDQGRGIAQNRLDQIFEPFRQENRTINRMYGGTGLGLAIVKGNVEVMGGRIYIKSEVNQGSTFSALVPYILSDHKEKKKIKKKLALPSGYQLIIAEDDHLSQKLMKRFLAWAGLDCTICKNGKELVDSVDKIMRGGDLTPIIITDIQMPEMGGIEAMERLRKMQGKDKFNIAALTASPEDFQHYDFDVVLAKPINFDKLTDVLFDMFENISKSRRGENSKSPAPTSTT